MDKATRRILIARIIQILFATISFGFSLALGVTDWAYVDAWQRSAPTYCSTIVAIAGTFGLFALKKRQDSTHDAKLFLLVLYIDVWALILSFVASTLTWVNGISYYWQINSGAIICVPGVFSALNVFVILYFIIRTSRMWSKGFLYNVSPEIKTDYEFEPQPQYIQPIYYVINDTKSDKMPRPVSGVPPSVLSDATLAYRPSIMETTHGDPSRAPSYKSRADAGPRIEKH